MSTLALGQTLRGANWNYQIVEPIEGDGTHNSTIFKARVSLRDGSTRAPAWAVIKTASPDDETARQNLRREYNTYRLPQVSRNPFFRGMYDIIGDSQNLNDDATGPTPCLALEWMDSTLSKLSYANVMYSYSIMTAIVKAVLSSSFVLHSRNLINTDTKPENILLSDVGTGQPTVKISDLGLVYPDGSHLFAQPYAMRAPEVYEGRPCVHKSQVWACAAMLLCWMKPGILGLAGNQYVIFREAWCIAKIRRLFPDWLPSPVDEIRKFEVQYSEELVSDLPPGIKNIASLEDEMHTIKMLPEVRDLLRCLFVVDLKERLSAAEALASKEFVSLEKKAYGGKN